jgi:general nucleoside transport system permease protein
MSTTFVAAVASSSILSGTSLLYATLGELVGERAGIVNLGLEGVMLIGAAVGFAATSIAGNPYFGVAAAALAGSATNLLLGYVVIARQANQLAAGLSLMFFGLGASALIGQPFVGAIVPELPRLGVPGLGAFDVQVWLALPTALFLWFALDGGWRCAPSARIRRRPLRPADARDRFNIKRSPSAVSWPASAGRICR